MPVGLNRVLRVAAAVFFLALLLPAAGLAKSADKCNASACKVYSEGNNAPSAGKQQQQPPPPQAPQTSGGGGGNSSSVTPTHTPKGLSRALAHAGADKAPLSRLLMDSGNGGPLRSGNVAGPSLLGAALDLGVGPLALLGILLAAALALAARGGARGWFRRRPSP